MKRVSILGATGSIGQNTIDLIARRDDISVVALTGGRNIAQLAKDALRLRARIAVTAHDELLPELRAALAGSGIEAGAGRAAVIEAGARPADWVMSAIVGAAGLEPGLAALRQGATLALANKESMVCAGALVRAEAARSGATLLPVDSEHSALLQALKGEDLSSVARITLTASGGAFRDWPLKDLAGATPEQAATHPNWDMGQRITIDSASMFNKALELIEAKELFDIAPDKIEAVIHPQSLVHAVVSYCDGGMIAHMGAHDMRHAIGYALNWPHRAALPVQPLDLAQLGRLEFRPVDLERYPALDLAQWVMRRAGLAGAAFNGAKERALDLFIARRIGFLDMARHVEGAIMAMDQSGDLNADPQSLEAVLSVDKIARTQVDARVEHGA